MKPDDDQPGVGPPDVEPGRFANFMSAQGVDAFKRFTPLKPGADSTVESVCGADRRQPLYPTLLSSAAAFESPQVSGVFQTAVADFTLGVIQGLQDDETDEAPAEDDPFDFDSDDTSDEEDAAAPTPRTLEQKKDLRAQHRKTYMGVRRDSPMGTLNPLQGTEQMIRRMHALPGCDNELAILDRHAQQQLASGFTWTAGVSSPGHVDENPDCFIIITGNFQPNTIDSRGSFKLGKNDEILYNQTMQYLCQTVPRVMAALGVIRPQDVQEFIKACKLLDRFPFPADANSSKGVTVSTEVRRTPCPEGMTITDFVEIQTAWDTVSLRYCQEISKTYPTDKVVFIAMGAHAQVVA